MVIFRESVEYLAGTLDVPDDAVRLVMGLVFGQVFTLLYRLLVSGVNSPSLKKAVNLLAGIFIGYFVWDVKCLHHAASALGFYLLYRILPWSLAARVNFAYQLGYIVVGYLYNNMTKDYAINWTTSQAILTLKMIGIGFDLNDSKASGAKLPSLLCIFGYTFFPGTYLVGPLDDFSRFTSFMDGTLFKDEPLPSISMGLKRLLHGVSYLVISMITTSFFPTEYIFSPGFADLAFPLRLLYVGAWGHCGLYKYLGVWCIAESSCMYIGYTYNGGGRWDGLRNVATSAFHQSTSLQDVINSWNINTSAWCAKHIYKRCRFLGSKVASQLITMLFLATWHGLHLGYFVCFFQEFVYMFMEKGSSTNPLVASISSSCPGYVCKLFGWLYTKVFLSFALVGFELYYYDVILYVYNSLYFCCPVAAVLLITSNAVFQENKTSKVE